MLRVIAILPLSIIAAIAAERTTLRMTWASRSYTTNAIPAAWLSANIPPIATDVSAFESFSLKTDSLSIQKFITRFGAPTRYLTTSKPGGQDFLIYDLPSGHTAALYVPKPPAESFAACVIITSDGSLVRLIK
jgi:hypothetical protein